MITLLVNILVVLMVLGLFYWVVTMIPLPPPVRQVAMVVVAVIGCIALIYLLLGATGGAVSLR